MLKTIKLFRKAYNLKSVIHIITGLTCGGAEHALFNLLAGGLADRVSPVVLSLQDYGTYGELIKAIGVPVHVLGIQNGFMAPGSIIRLRNLVRDVQPDVIQGWMYHGNLAASLAGWLAPGRPAVSWNIRHSLYSLADEKLLTRQVIRANQRLSSRVDAIVYNSSISRQQHEAFGFAKLHGQVISNGFDVKALRPRSVSREIALAAMPIPKNALVVGHVARFHPMKDHASFLRAAVQVALQLPHAHFLVAGREVNLDNPALAGVVPAELFDRFHFLGERDDVPILMQAMDVFCISSAWGEAFPNVLGEAMASGVPCVTTDVGDSAIIVGDTGIVVPPSDVKALAQGLLNILTKTEDERRSLGDAARMRVICNYALPSIVDEYSDLYTTLIK